MPRDLVDAKLCENWSPEQISGWPKLAYADEEVMRVCTSQSTKARSCKHAACYAKSCATISEVSVNSAMLKVTSQDPDSRSLREYPFVKGPQPLKTEQCQGIGKATSSIAQKNRYIATVVERQTRFTILAKID